MKLSYNNFIRLLLVVIIASVIIVSKAVNNMQIIGAILALAFFVETLCVLRLSTLGYSTFEAIKRLLLKGDKFLVFINRVPEK